MNLIDSPWMPARTRDGTRTWISPLALCEPMLDCFDADRPDFNGALAQFAIGLLQTTAPVDSPMAWRALYKTPPDSATLESWFLPHRAAFEFEGDGARFMQDFELRTGVGEALSIAGLLIESPGENALKNNSDHFVKRGRIQQLCAHCAALALFTLQINAPAGGVGHRTGLRGGGPLTTLLRSRPKPGESSSLWHDLWLNVRERRFTDGGSKDRKPEPHFTFPWLAPMSAIQAEGGAIAPIQVHPDHVFWAMPRRIRLDLDATTSGACDLCARENGRLVGHYVTRNYGLNYKGPWKHPLSPYYENKEGWLPLHPQPGGIGYRHWLGWVLGMQDDRRKLEAAGVVTDFLASGLERKTGSELQIWAFGFDMDNMKARCWYESSLPLYGLGDCDATARIAVRQDVGAWLAGADLAANLLRGAIKDAWFEGDARGDFSTIDASFWSRTEPAFYTHLRDRIAAARDDSGWDRVAGAERWHATLRRAAMDLFDHQFVGAGPVERQDPARVARAYRLLRGGLDGPRMRAALGLSAPPGEAAAKSGRKVTKPRGAKA